MKASFKKAIAAAAAAVTALCGMAVGVGAAAADDSTPPHYTEYASTASGKLTVNAPNGTTGHTLTAYLVAAYNKDYAAYTDTDSAVTSGTAKAGNLNIDTFRYVVHDSDETAIENALTTAGVTAEASGSQTAAEEGLKSLTGVSATSPYGYDVNTNTASAQERKFADALAALLNDTDTTKKWTPSISKDLTLGQENTLTPEGLYLVIDTYKQDDDKVANSTQSVPMLVGTTFATLTVTDENDPNKNLGVGTIDMKNTTAPITKQVVGKDGTTPNNHPSYNIGDTVFFQLTTTIPDFTGYASDPTLKSATTRLFNIVDTFQDGSFEAQKVESVTDKTAVDKTTNQPLALNPGTDYDVTGESTNTLTVDLKRLVNGAAGAQTGWKAGDEIVVIVSATLAKGATTTDSPNVDAADKTGADPQGNYNKVELNYSNNPSDNSKMNNVPGPTVNVYSFNLNLNKVGPDGKSPVSGAGFTVKTGETTYKFTKQTDSATGKVTYVVDNVSGTTDQVLSGEDGTISIKGLDAGTYTVEETKVPSGYFSGARPTFTVTIADTSYQNDKTNNAPKGTADGAGDDWLTGLTYTTFTPDFFNLVTQDNADKDGFTVKNVKSVTQLPKTGAAGIAFFSFIGLALIAAAAFFAIRARKAAKIA
ncbi:SpaA isopeptide-forming pilin-related protein [Pseudoscardovia suis]|uniref:Uncharacterized protein n=1 Tax=Pseudoscardovia suis TaxID=987063 RepID=A0A261EX46_9BIFI|nr:SpaA isopeptide-forming pilin-related protein [Pseudoscardovia suis]OZG51417.1 hypothetical protein PSSU_1040 [Pseudoscardovia suis]PJJ68700.1 LPXTG-motif cell wall-anchored protein [Pseudoscardovia suis]